eukprot:854826-Amphidinium_carterae.1
MTWRLAAGTLLFALGSLRTAIDTGSDYLVGGESVAGSPSAARAEFEGPIPDDPEAKPTEDPWIWIQYRRGFTFLHHSWLWFVRTLAWNLLPFNRAGIVGWFVHQIGQATFGGKWIYVQVVLGFASVVLLLYVFGSVLGVIAFGLEWAVIRPCVAVWRIARALVLVQPPPKLAQLDFRGPTGAKEVDNDFYKKAEREGR